MQKWRTGVCGYPPLYMRTGQSCLVSMRTIAVEKRQLVERLSHAGPTALFSAMFSFGFSNNLLNLVMSRTPAMTEAPR